MSAALAALEAVAPTFPRDSRYRVGRAIADGPTGPVYLGFQRGVAGFERIVVVKHAPEHPRDLVLAEVARTAGVRHPNLVGIDDIEDHDGELYLVSEYFEGATLADLTDLATERRIPAAIALRIALDVCAALEAVHGASYVHRNVSAHNVLVGSDGITRVVDFGLPEPVRSPGGRASRGPRGVAMESDDLQAFAVMLWEMLAGRRLTKSPSKAPLVSSIIGDLTPLFDAAVAKALGVWPLERFPSITETRIALEGAAHGFVASHEDVADFVSCVAQDAIDEQRSEIRSKAFVSDDTDDVEEVTGRISRAALGSIPEIVIEVPQPVVVRSIKTEIAKLGLALFLVTALCLTTAFACGAFFR